MPNNHNIAATLVSMNVKLFRAVSVYPQSDFFVSTMQYTILGKQDGETKN